MNSLPREIKLLIARYFMQSSDITSDNLLIAYELYSRPREYFNLTKFLVEIYDDSGIISLLPIFFKYYLASLIPGARSVFEPVYPQKYVLTTTYTDKYSGLMELSVSRESSGGKKTKCIKLLESTIKLRSDNCNFIHPREILYEPLGLVLDIKTYDQLKFMLVDPVKLISYTYKNDDPGIRNFITKTNSMLLGIRGKWDTANN